MCRETTVDRHRMGTETETLTSIQPPTGKGGVAIRSPKTPGPSGNKGLRQHRTMRESESGGGDPFLPPPGVLSLKPSSGQSPRLLPYFPKPGVTSPPPSLSLARNPDHAAMWSPSTFSKGSSARSPSPASISRPKLNTLSKSSSSPSLAAHSVPGQAAFSRGALRNASLSPSPRVAARNAPLSSASRSALGASQAPVTASKASARTQSPTPSTRSTARNPSPMTTARKPSPSPSSSRGSLPTPSPAPTCRAGALHKPAASAGVENSPSSGSTCKTTAMTRRAASPAGHRKDAPPHRAKDCSIISTMPETVRNGSMLASPLPSRNMSKSLNTSFRKDRGGEGARQSTLENLTFPPITSLDSVDRQTQRRGQMAGCGRKAGGPKAGRVACEGMLPGYPPVLTDSRKRCHWVTPQSESDLVTYHDEVWGVPVHDDKLLFELLVLEGAQSELSRPQLLSMREYFREVFGSFDPAIVAKFDERKVAALKVDEIIRQPEPKIRGVIENANQVLKIMEEFGSFDKYLWNFVGFRAIVNTPRNFTQIPVKSSKSEALSKDLMRRGFRYVGPTTVYSFMQAAGMVNDHLVSCYRHGECCVISQMEVMESGASGDKTDH